MKKVLVTGANGFIGSSLLQYFSDNDVEVFAVIKDISERVNHIESLKNVHIVYCEMDSIEKLPELIADCDIDTCIHLAWAGSFGELRADYALQLKNIDYAMRTINTIYKMGIKRFVCAGTLAEKDVLNYHPTEGATPNPVSMYGIAKITTHFMTKTECTKLGIEHIWCYLSNTYGVGNTTNNFVNMACKKLLNNERAAFTAGEQYYDFMYITDTVRAIAAVTENGKTNCSYYLGSAQARPLREYIKLIRDAIDPSIPLYLGEIPFNGNALPEEAYDISSLVKDTGFHPQIRFEEGIKKTVSWLKTIKQ